LCLHQIHIRDGKSAKDRITMLPDLPKVPLQDHLKQVKAVNQTDVADGWPRPASERTRPQVPQRAEGLVLAMGLSPGTPMDQSQYIGQGRHHIVESLVHKAGREAVAKAGLTKRATCHTHVRRRL
jgi:hypothetical protein